MFCDFVLTVFLFFYFFVGSRSASLSWHPSTLKAKDTKMQLKWMKNRVPNVRCDPHCGIQNRRTVAIAWSSRSPLRWFSCFTLGFSLRFCFNYFSALVLASVSVSVSVSVFGWIQIAIWLLQAVRVNWGQKRCQHLPKMHWFRGSVRFGFRFQFWALINRPKRSVKSNVGGKQLRWFLHIKGA